MTLARVGLGLNYIGRLVGEPPRHANEQVTGIFLGDEFSHDVAPQLEQVHP